MDTQENNPATIPAILTYRVSTDPGPIQASVVNTLVNAHINISVSSGKTVLYCNRIRIAVPIGKTETDFSEKNPVAYINTSKWTVESVVNKKGSELGLDDKQNFATFTFRTRDKADDKIDYDLVLGLNSIVNDIPGKFLCLIEEDSGTDPNPANFKPRRLQFTLEKTTPQFYLKNFITTNPASPTVPCSEFANGSNIRLSWESNGTWFQLYRKNETTPVFAGTETSCTVSLKTATDTTFILSACVSGKPGGSGQDFYPIFLYDSISVTISNPDLTPKNISASGNTLLSTLEVTGATKLHNTTVEGTHTVVGATKLHDTTIEGTQTVGGNTKLHGTVIEGTLSVTGKSELDNLTVKNGLTASSATINNLTAGALASNGNTNLNGNTDIRTLNVSGNFNVSGTASIIQTGNQAMGYLGKHTAKSDMFITGNISGNKDVNGTCFGTITIVASGQRLNASGGHILGPPGFRAYNFGGAVTAFIKKGEQYELILEKKEGQPNYAFYCWGIGALI